MRRFGHERSEPSARTEECPAILGVQPPRPGRQIGANMPLRASARALDTRNPPDSPSHMSTHPAGPSTRDPDSKPPVRRPGAGRQHDGSRRWIYTGFSGRTQGVDVGVNLSPGGHCDDDCLYCSAAGMSQSDPLPVDLGRMLAEFEETLVAIRCGRAFDAPDHGMLPAEFREVGQVMLSGDGEPTLCPNFLEVVETLVHIRARGRHPFFRLVFETNGSGIETIAVRQALVVVQSLFAVFGGRAQPQRSMTTSTA